MKAKGVKTIDLFCGAGGSSYGAQKAGAKLIAGFDMWSPAVITYKKNFCEEKDPSPKIYTGDIRDLCPEQIKEELGQVDLLLGSPECTHHSKARGNATQSEESRRTAFQISRYASKLMPEWIVVENVVEMKNWEGHQELKARLVKLGYKITETILNAKNFGVPQSRERLFLLCGLSSAPEKPPLIEQNPPMNTIIDTSERYNFTLVEKKGRAQKTIDTVKRAIEALGEDVPFLLVYYGSGRKGGTGGWQTLNEPLRTITTLDRFALVRPSENGHMMRMLQPEELKLAMGYDRAFKLDEVERLTRRDRIKLMGNGVCPPVMQAIVETLVSA